MKKFSRTMTAGLGAVAALALAACSPPHEQPSDVKIDNANTYTGEAQSGSEEESSAEGTSEPAESEAAESESAAEGASEEPSAAAEDAAQWIDCASIPTTEPESITLDCFDQSADNLTNIEWTSWDGETAEGTATRTTGAVATEGVEVVLSNPTETPQGPAFTEITVDGELINQ